MDDDVVHTQIRKFLKKVGINSQRALEDALRRAEAEGRLPENGPLHAQVTLEVPELGLKTEIDDTLALEKKGGHD